MLRAYLPGRDITAVSKGLALAAEQVNAGAVLLPGLTALVTAAQAREPFAGAEPAPPQPHSDEPTTTQRHSDALLAELDGLIGLDAVNGQLRPDRPQGAAGGGVSVGGVLFIDEAYSLSSGQQGKDFGQEAVDTLMEDHRNNLVVIAAELELEESAAAPLKQSLQELIQQQGSNLANGRSVRRLFEQVQTNQANRLMQQPGNTSTQAELRMILAAVITAASLEAPMP